MADLRVRVLAVADASLRSAFKPLEEAADAAQKKVRGLGKAVGGPEGKSAQRESLAIAREKIRAAREAHAEIERGDARARANSARLSAREAKDSVKVIERQTRDELRIKEKAHRDEVRLFDQKFRARQASMKAEEREILRTAATAERVESRKQNQQNNRDRHQQNKVESGRQRMAMDFGGSVTRSLGGAARGSMSVASEFARGAGVDTSLANTFGRGNRLQSMAVDLSNQGLNTAGGKGRESPQKVEARIREVADATGMDRETVAAGIGNQVGKTGNLQTALAGAMDLAKMSKATGSSFADMADAAGDVGNALGEAGDMGNADKKAQRIADIMRTFSFQGKMGAVEIKNMASQMAKLGSAAGQFEGDAGDNMVKLGALMQLARAEGGASSATQAATAISGMTNTFKTPARVAAFKKQGIDVFNEQGQIKDPVELMKQAFTKTRQGDPTDLKKMFYNVIGAKPVESLSMTYRKAYQAAGGSKNDKAADKAGLAAVDAKMAKFNPTTDKARKQIAGDMDSAFAATMGTNESKAQILQNSMDDVAARLSEKLAPAASKLVPILESLANKGAAVVSWMAENPGKAIVAAIVGSIGKAGLETALKTAVEGILKTAIGGTGAAPAAGKAGLGAGLGTLGNVAAGLTIAATAVTVTAAGIALIDAAFDSSDRADSATRDSQTESQNLRSEVAGKARMGSLTTADFEALNAKVAEYEAKVASGEKAKKDSESTFYGTTSLISGVANFASGGSAGTSFDAQEIQDQNAKALADNKAELAAVKASIDSLIARISGGINVNNFPPQAGGAPGRVAEE